MLHAPKEWWLGLPAPVAFTYDPRTLEHVGETECDPSPLEPDVWLVPGCATLIAPPPKAIGVVACFDEKRHTWQHVEDHRGKVLHDGEKFVTVTGLGPLPHALPVVHDAQFILPDHNGPMARIRMSLNDVVIEFDDVDCIERQVLAAWEAAGETIRPVDAPETTPYDMTEAEEDERAAAIVEGRETEETQT